MLTMPTSGPKMDTSPSLPTGPPATEKKNKEASKGAVRGLDDVMG